MPEIDQSRVEQMISEAISGIGPPIVLENDSSGNTWVRIRGMDPPMKVCAYSGQQQAVMVAKKEPT